MLRVALTVACASLVVAPAQARSTSATLRLTDDSPLAVHGSGFHARERVTVVATAQGATRRKVVTAGAHGGFTVRFTSLHATQCPGYSVRATGGLGSRATLKPRPAECPPPPPPLTQ